MTEELQIWSVAESGEVKPLSPLQQMLTEREFEDLLVQNPEMLGSGLKLVGRQTKTQTGWLDLLAVDQDGRLVVYELKRGTLTREAVTQVLDYASYLDTMSSSDLAEHIARHSGNGGIQGIDDFEQWYADNFGGDDPSRLLPPRMVLVGLGVDPAAERMARFVSGGPVDLSVATFRGFVLGGKRLLARQVEVEPGTREPASRRRSASVNERREELRKHLTDNGYVELFDRIRYDIRQCLPERGVWEEPGRLGIGFQLNEPGAPGGMKRYFGVYAGYREQDYSVSILPQAIQRGGSSLERLRESVQLHEWPHGGHVCHFASEDTWAEHGSAVLEFVSSVITNLSNDGEEDT